LFQRQGATFIQSPDALASRLSLIRALIFDWDGVFNRGEKAVGSASGFSEADSMGINMLRYALWRRDGRLPVIGIISGEKNAAAEQFAQREHFDALYLGIRDKRRAMEAFCERYALQPGAVACIFDDINDIEMARDCGLRILVRRDASPLLRAHLEHSGRCDYVTACESGRYAVREATELLLGLTGSFEEVVSSRCAYDDSYRSYLAVRQSISLETGSVAATD